jgi:hypothetical protein
MLHKDSDIFFTLCAEITGPGTVIWKIDIKWLFINGNEYKLLKYVEATVMLESNYEKCGVLKLVRCHKITPNYSLGPILNGHGTHSLPWYYIQSKFRLCHYAWITLSSKTMGTEQKTIIMS